MQQHYHAEQGEPWIAALAGHHVDPLKQQAEQQRLMLERFQQEVRKRHQCLHHMQATIALQTHPDHATFIFAI